MDTDGAGPLDAVEKIRIGFLNRVRLRSVRIEDKSMLERRTPRYEAASALPDRMKRSMNVAGVESKWASIGRNDLRKFGAAFDESHAIQGRYARGEGRMMHDDQCQVVGLGGKATS